ncbi:uncharacterized protein LOC100875160 isoform X1 [Megachile rotundata]|uniref:uncharacterized protein LOC100875160 isoform X1 n=1 Tax=Megachile rotundata TaxID=143995 RepID=UPI003FD10B8D
MGAIVELFLLAVLCTSVGEVHGECRHVENQDMIEYSCEGGQVTDLNDLPASTGKIRIRNMPMTRITADTFSRFGEDLWVLSCSECQIRDIDPNAFQRLNYLQQLSLDNNYLTTVKEAWFRGLDYLTYLDLNFNYIETIEEGVFRNLPSLIDLRLAGNRLECLNLEDLTNLSDLKRIFLTENSEFKCPNAISTFLENRGVLFDRDPEWDRIPNDLIAVEVPDDYYIDEDITSEEPSTPMPMHRERLHPTPATPPPPPMESTPSYTPPRFYTTEEVIYRPMYTPNWRTTPAPTTESYEERVEPSSPSPYRENVIRPYVPPATIAPIEPDETTQSNVQDTFRSWPIVPETTSARSEYPFYPPHENEDRRFEEQYYSSEATFPLAPGPVDRHETPPFVESDVGRATGPYRTDWYERNTVSSVNEGPPEYNVPPTNSPVPNNVVQSLPPTAPEMVHPPSPDNTFQAPYYEHTITVHSPPLVGNLPAQEEITPSMIPMETTTDKPLPNCPNRSVSWAKQSTLGTIVVSLLVVTISRVLVEGF